jgi:hypothetical protein
MGLFDNIEKLINEHGSAVILKERLLLAEDKYSALERKASALETENAKLRGELQQTKNEVKILQSRAEAITNGTADFDDTTNAILRIIFRVSNRVSVYSVADSLCLEYGIAEYHFDLLRGCDFIVQVYAGDPPLFELTPGGRAYVVKNLLPK